jgi:hypothetical protein
MDKIIKNMFKQKFNNFYRQPNVLGVIKEIMIKCGDIWRWRRKNRENKYSKIRERWEKNREGRSAGKKVVDIG